MYRGQYIGACRYGICLQMFNSIFEHEKRYPISTSSHVMKTTLLTIFRLERLSTTLRRFPKILQLIRTFPNILEITEGLRKQPKTDCRQREDIENTPPESGLWFDECYEWRTFQYNTRLFHHINDVLFKQLLVGLTGWGFKKPTVEFYDLRTLCCE